jgi:hypothetical protein
MKYLSNRDEFLKRSINKIDEYKSLENKSLEVINEAESGPFANDIPWNDSLLGRLINSTIRKAKIGANLVRIKGVNRRLKDAFDELLGKSALAEMSKEDKREFSRVQIFSVLENLKKSVEEGHKVIIIKNLTDSAIKNLEWVNENVPAEELFTDKDNVEKLIKQLKEFREFLDQFKDNEGNEDASISDEDSKEGDEEVSSSDKSSESMYPNMIKNLKSLGGILESYKRTKIVADQKPTASSEAEAGTYKTKAGDTILKIQADNTVNAKKLTSVDIRSKNTKVLTSYPKDNQTLPAGLLLVLEGYVNEELTIGQGMGADRGNIKQGEDHASQAFLKIKKDIEVLESAKDKGIGIDINFINAITSKSIDSKTKDLVKGLYVEINRYLVGDKKSTIQDKDPLYKESIEIISDKNKKVIVAEKIARFTKRALQFDKEGLYGQLGDLGKSLQVYVDSIKLIMAMEAPKVEAKKEKVLSKYTSFISLIKEADENQPENKDGEVSEPVVMNTSQKITDWWDKKIDIKEFVLTRSEAEKIRINFEKESQKEAIVIDGLDPIIEIVKVFNRAYKIHTTQVIPTGRSGGKVSNKTFQEYTTFGGGIPETAGASGGPYRNNAIFDQWEDAVQNIIKDTKYQKIFREETTLKTSDGNTIKDAGKNLLKFMNDMLDGDTLYKTRDGKGRQAEFIEKYFSPDEKDKKKLEEKGSLTMGGEEEEKEISKNADSIKTKNLDFTDSSIKFQNYDDLTGSIFALSTNDNKQIYFYLQAVDNGYAYLSYCRSMYFIKKYITESGNSITLGKGSLPFDINDGRINKDGKEYMISAFRIKPESLIDKEGKFILSGNYLVKKVTKFEGDKNMAAVSKLSEKEEEISFKSFYALRAKSKNEEGKEISSRFILKNATASISKNGGFTNISTSNDINKTSLTKK